MPALEVEPRVVVSPGNEIATPEFYVVGIKQNAASELIVGGDFVYATGLAGKSDVSVFVAPYEGFDSLAKFVSQRL